ncbi:E3 ubiquitin-protein ligase HECW2, partial [Geodia barretti]
LPVCQGDEQTTEVRVGQTRDLSLVQTIRSDHSQFPRYQHNSKLVALLNSFARTECELPAGWERRKDTRSGRVVFVDHHTQRTTYIDPRLPYPGNNLSISSTSVRGVASRSRPYASPDHQPQPRRRRSRDPAAPSPSPAPPPLLPFLPVLPTLSSTPTLLPPLPKVIRRGWWRL